MRNDLPMQCDAEQTYEPLTQQTRRQISMCARYLAIVQNRPFSEMPKTNEGRQAC
jgi:hypothetical protein